MRRHGSLRGVPYESPPQALPGGPRHLGFQAVPGGRMMGVFVQLNEESFRAKTHPIGYVIQENGCWDWVGHTVDGYGRWMQGGKPRLAYRVLYEKTVGVIPTSLQIDHLCRNPRCVNPAHLEPVTAKENNRRSTSPTSVNGRKTHCVRGHEFTESNVWIYFRNGGRQCRICKRIRDAEYKRRRNGIA